MSTDSAWNSRWRSESHYQGHFFDPMQPPRPPAPAIGNHRQAPQSLQPSVDSYSGPWDGKSQGISEHHAHGVPSRIDRSADASTYHSRLHERHTSPRRNSSLTNSPTRQKLTEPWHSLPVDHRAQNRNITDAPLTLHIPQTQDLPKIPTVYPPTSAHSQGPYKQQTPTLPSFASLSGQAGRSDDPDEVEIAPMSARLPCHTCNKLTPMVREVAMAIADLDENVQQYCNKSITRTCDFPKDSPVRAVQWILERLVKTKADLQDTARRMQSSYFYAQPASFVHGTPSQMISPPSGVKRPGDRWDQDELPMPKRPRSGASLDELHRTTSNSISKDDRRGSLDFTPRSPQPTDSVPGSAYPRAGSPGLSARPNRPLPSPSSLAYPLSAAPSVAPPTAASGGSPSTSYQPAVSIHTASTNSATSAHIADLQHQVTLKSLALQTLQSEYASLLQKLQRERVKSQTIEKKTSVADQEVNDLTSKNEDLTEQLKSLETQLEECERKRELERSTAASEKEQWTRILEMNDRLQSKSAEQNQKLREEKNELSQRVAAYEDGSSSRFDSVKRSSTSRVDATRPGADTQGSGEKSAATAAGSLGDATNDVETLKSEIAVLNSRIDVLRYSLEEAKRRSQSLGDKAREFVESNVEIGTSIDRTLDEDAKTSRRLLEQQPSAASGRSTPTRQKPSWSPSVQTGQLNSSRTLSKSPNPQELPTPAPTTSLSDVSMAAIGRAVSPGPAELGFHVTPSTSSPEDLIRALGPVPAPLAPMQFGSLNPAHDNSKRGNSGQKKKLRKQPAIAAPSETSNVGSFRPLNHHVPAQPFGFGRPVKHEGAYQSFQESPNSTADRTSPNSSRSESRRSSNEEKYASSTSWNGQNAFTSGWPPSADASTAFTMPPPPRPSMSLKDMCSAPTAPISKP